MASMLADVVNAGTGSEARRLGFTLPAAGKTGNDQRIPRRVVRRLHAEARRRRVGRLRRAAHDSAGRLRGRRRRADLGAFMKAATKGEAPEWLAPPPGVTAARVCRLSGELATRACDAYTDYFAAGTAPTAYCDLHSSPGLIGKVAAWFGRGRAACAASRRSRPRTRPRRPLSMTAGGRRHPPRPSPAAPPARRESAGSSRASSACTARTSPTTPAPAEAAGLTAARPIRRRRGATWHRLACQIRGEPRQSRGQALPQVISLPFGPSHRIDAVDARTTRPPRNRRMCRIFRRGAWLFDVWRGRSWRSS